MATTPPTDADAGEFAYDVVIIGGGPAGCSAGVFLARAGLETAIFDRGRSSIKRCAHLENYLGFPDGLDIETLYDLLHDHAVTAGCEIVPELVASVDRRQAADGFVVSPQNGDTTTARRVVAATRYDGEYMRGLDDETAMFETYEYDGETHQQFDRDYADHDGTTPVEDLYVVSPSEEADMQAIIAAGRGARVARRLIADVRLATGWWNDVAEVYDWVRREAELDKQWTDREAWVESFDEHHAEDAPVAPDSERYQRVREESIADSRGSYIDAEAIETRKQRGHETLAAHLDPEAIVMGVDETALLDAMDEATIRQYIDGDHHPAEVSD